MSELIKAGRKKDFPENRATGVTLNGRGICIANEKGSFYAFDDRCTHAESLLSSGDLEDGEVVCPLHGARFSIKTGEALTLPAVKPVKTYRVQVKGDDVFVELD